MALAIWFDHVIRDGVVAEQAELARIGQVGRSRLTQIMSLPPQAPVIPTEIPLLSAAECVRDKLAG